MSLAPAHDLSFVILQQTSQACLFFKTIFFLHIFWRKLLVSRGDFLQLLLFEVHQLFRMSLGKFLFQILTQLLLLFSKLVVQLLKFLRGLIARSVPELELFDQVETHLSLPSKHIFQTFAQSLRLFSTLFREQVLCLLVMTILIHTLNGMPDLLAGHDSLLKCRLE